MPTIHRFYVDEPLPAAGVEVSLPPHVAHQAGTVLRLRSGDPVVLFDGSGGEWRGEIVSLHRGAGFARLLRHGPGLPEPRLRLTLCQAMIKADRFELVLQKGTEMGVAAFQPLLTKRVVGATGKGSPSQRAQERLLKTERWRRIVVEAAEQSGRTAVPDLREPRALRTVLAEGAPTIVCWEQGTGAPPLRDAVARVLPETRRNADTVPHVCILIGPEGGFTPDEVDVAVAAGAHTATLGPLILRSETAAIAAAALALLP